MSESRKQLESFEDKNQEQLEKNREAEIQRNKLEEEIIMTELRLDGAKKGELDGLSQMSFKEM